MTKHVHARLFLAALFAALIVTGPVISGPAAAQDAVPGTPTELKDFKLDPEKAPPVRQPLPTTEPLVKPPAPNPAAARAPVIEVPAVTERAPAARTPAVKAPLVKPEAKAKAGAKAEVKPLDRATMQLPSNPALTAGGVSGDEAVQDADAELPATASEAAETAPAITAPDTTAPDTTAPDTTMADTAPASSLPWNYILAALLAAIGVSAAIFYRRRRRDDTGAHDAIFDRVEDPADGHSIAVPDPVTQLAAVTSPIIPAPIIPPQISANRPKLEISFVPEKASISLANLTIKGRLHIINNGADDAAAMQLNAAVISASEGQGQAISRYFTSTLPPGKELGAAKVGEQIALEMDLMIPIADLQTFLMGKQKLLVPIILARVEYQWGDDAQDGTQHGTKHRDEAQLSCLIGREASPPKPKMGALRLDLGPRSFASLGQRPLPG